MAKIKHLFPGGNTCNGFYSFYDHMVSPAVKRKYILKGGPGVGKSTLMKRLGEDFAAAGHEVEYHWCSSDNNSLDGVVLGAGEYCILDGTAPHVVDPVYPGAVDEIINLGEYWDRNLIEQNRDSIVTLTARIGRCFSRAYNRLKESRLAMDEWASYYDEIINTEAVSRNVLALAADFLAGVTSYSGSTRHLFASAITPLGLVEFAESLLDPDTSIFSIKGSPGSGKAHLFSHILDLIKIRAVRAEVYHNPLDPTDVDIILLPDTKAALIDVSGYPSNYEAALSGHKIKRMLDFDPLIPAEAIDRYHGSIAAAHQRFDAGINDAIANIKTAKDYHDELETYYTPAMDLDSIEQFRSKLRDELMELLK
ncbi:MAG: PRK06851 family protein [Deltaproteobacteria bacterium]